jgi:hypothetical protein
MSIYIQKFTVKNNKHTYISHLYIIKIREIIMTNLYIHFMI